MELYRVKIRIYFVLALVFFLFSHAQGTVSICSWNIRDFGKSKSDAEINFIATTVKYFDIVAVQEVVAGYGGAQAVSRLSDALNRTGSKWDYSISEPTTGASGSSERYAFLWKTSKVKATGKGWLDSNFRNEIDREPFLMEFTAGAFRFTIVNFHAISPSRKPETEIKYLRFFPERYSKHSLIFIGDFNLKQAHGVFGPLKSQGYKTAFSNQRTSLRMKCVEADCLSGEYDNALYNEMKILLIQSGAIHFYKKFKLFSDARLISDHMPVWMEIDAK